MTGWIPLGFAVGAKRLLNPVDVDPKPRDAVVEVAGVINEKAGAPGFDAPNREDEVVAAALVAPNREGVELAAAPKSDGAVVVVVAPKVGADAWVPNPKAGGLAGAEEVAPKGGAAKVGAEDVVAVPNVRPPTAGAAVPVGLLPKLNICSRNQWIKIGE